MCARIFVAVFCLFYLCAPQAAVVSNQAQTPAEELLLNCGMLTAAKMNRGSYKVGVLIDLAKIYLEIGQKAKAADVLAYALGVASVKEPQTMAESMLKDSSGAYAARIASVYAKAGMLDRAFEIIGPINKPSDRARALAWVASEIVESGQTSKASELLSQALRLLRPADNERPTLFWIATTYAKLGECDSALKAAEMILPRWEYFRAHILAATAAECAKAGRKDKASGIISLALQTANSIKVKGDSERIALNSKTEALAEIASAYVDLGEPDKAANILPEAVKIARLFTANNVALRDIAAAYAKAGRFVQAIEVAKSIDYRSSKADALIDIAREHINAGNNQAGIEVLAEAVEVTRKLKVPDDSFKIDHLCDIGSEYARAGQRLKASETLLYALRETWAADKYSQPGMLVDIAKAYTRAKVELDAEAKAVLKKICAGEPIPPTADELAKQKRAEDAADRFIQRWHETLDLNVLFDELYVTNPEQRRKNIYRFYEPGPADAKDVDEKLIREGFMAFFNIYYLMREYDLAFSTSGDERVRLPQELSEASKKAEKLRFDEKRMAASIRQYIANANHLSSVLRKYLKPDLFETEQYKQNLKRYLAEKSKDSKPFRTDHGFSRYGVGEEVEVYALERGIFDFYFIEEKGELRVLTLGFEL